MSNTTNNESPTNNETPTNAVIGTGKIGGFTPKELAEQELAAQELDLPFAEGMGWGEYSEEMMERWDG